MSPFERFGIKHLSPSSLAVFRNDPAFWCLRYVHGFKDESGVAAMRGQAVEAGLDVAVFGGSDEDATAAALAKFDELVAGEVSDSIDAERQNIPGMLLQAAGYLRPLGKPMARQVKIELWFDGIEIPVIGFVDYAFENGDVDLKTTLRIPSQARPDHVAQVAVYNAARRREQKLLYVSPKRRMPFDVEPPDLEGALWAVKRSAKALRCALSLCEDKPTLTDLFAPRLDSFYWNDNSRAAALEIWT